MRPHRGARDAYSRASGPRELVAPGDVEDVVDLDHPRVVLVGGGRHDLAALVFHGEGLVVDVPRHSARAKQAAFFLTTQQACVFMRSTQREESIICGRACGVGGGGGRKVVVVERKRPRIEEERGKVLSSFGGRFWRQ